MTRDFNQFISCPYCEKSFPAETAFNRWMRKQPRLDSKMGVVRTDLDNIIHRYKRTGQGREFQTLMIIEVKEYFAEPNASQRDTLVHFDQFIRNRSRNMHMEKHARKQIYGGTGWCKLYSTIAKKYIRSRFFGVHLVQFERNCPENSNIILWDRKHQITAEQLLDLLAMDLDPDNLQPMEETLRDRHRQQRTLFNLAA